MKNGTLASTDPDFGNLKYTGDTVKDTVCVGTSTTCVPQFEFLVVVHDRNVSNEL